MLCQAAGKEAVQLGRDKFLALLSADHLLARRRRISGTQRGPVGVKGQYPNLVKGLKLIEVNQVWVSAITYWRTGLGFVYVSLLMDAYSRKIVGYSASLDLRARHNVSALKLALSSLSGRISVRT